jgi:uncharacterized membrane protein YdjX (TVP38/TMEM64 family)
VSFHAGAGFSTKKSKKLLLHAMRRTGTWLLLLLLVGGLLLARWKWGAEFEPKLLVVRLRELGAHPAAVGIFVLLYLVGTSVLVPAVGFAIVAAVVWGYGAGMAVSLLALNLVSNVHFLAGRAVGRARVEKWLERRGWSAAVLRESGVTTMIAVRQLPLPFVAVNVAAGVSPLKWWHFAVGSAIGAIPPTVVYTWFATALIDGVEGARTEALLKALAGGAMIVTLALAPKVWARWRSRRVSA